MSSGAFRRSRGAIIVQFAMLAFGFFAIAAVVVDVRLASYAQQQMQVASDAAATDAIGWRDHGRDRLRDEARDRVAQTFDDDLDPDNGDERNFGAGPVIDLVSTRPGNAGALITIPADPVYDPVLESNDANDAAGDVVTGDFDETDRAHAESDDYSRTDFAPLDLGGAARPDAVLVRLRRTNDVFGLDRVAGVSSAGPPIPFLFGMGSTMHRAPGASYDPRTDGLTVRSTSIAEARRALEVSGPGPRYAGFHALQRFVLFNAEPHLPPGQPFPPPGQQFSPPGQLGPPSVRWPPPGQRFPPPGQGVNRPPPHPTQFFGFWEQVTVGQRIELLVDDDGYLHRRAPAGGPSPFGDTIGYFATAIVPSGVAGVVTQVGQVPDVIPPAVLYRGETHVPIAQRITNSAGEQFFSVIGFGWIHVTVLAPQAGIALRFELTKLPSTIWPTGVSAVCADALAALSASPALQDAHRRFLDPVQAPVLVR